MVGPEGTRANTIRRFEVPPNGVYTDFRGWDGTDAGPGADRRVIRAHGLTLRRQRDRTVDAAVVLAALFAALVIRLL